MPKRHNCEVFYFISYALTVGHIYLVTNPFPSPIFFLAGMHFCQKHILSSHPESLTSILQQGEIPTPKIHRFPQHDTYSNYSGYRTSIVMTLVKYPLGTTIVYLTCKKGKRQWKQRVIGLCYSNPLP